MRISASNQFFYLMTAAGASRLICSWSCCGKRRRDPNLNWWGRKHRHPPIGVLPRQNGNCAHWADLSILAHPKIMRPKVVLAILLAGVLAVGSIIYLKSHSSAPAPNTAPASAAPTPTPAPAPAPAPVVVKKILTPEQRQAAIDAETDRLQEWSMSDDPASLSNILADLSNPEKEIREAAIEAAKQFGSSNAIPTLKAVAANTPDTEEQIALLEAANFLSLPSMTFGGPATPQTPEQIQAAAQRRAESKARRQAQMQNRAGNQNPQTPPDQNPSPAPNQ
jgi:hypothetical protein